MRIEETIDLTFGRFEALHYAVVDGDRVEHYWFALALPGMPVKTEDRDNGELRFAMTMIQHVPGRRSG